MNPDKVTLAFGIGQNIYLSIVYITVSWNCICSCHWDVSINSIEAW